MDRGHDSFSGRSLGVLAAAISFIVLTSLFVFLRLFSRLFIVKKISIDDHFMFVAWAFAAALAFCICFGCAYGLGRHQDHVPADWEPTMHTATYAFSVLYQFALMATKTSILAFYLALPTTNKNFKWACIGTLFVVNAGGLALGLFTIFECTPVDAAFHAVTPQGAQCTDILTIYLSSAPLNIITDLAILFLPMPILTTMRLPRKQKIILIITFSFGVFVVVVDILRIVYLQSAAEKRLQHVSSGGGADGSSTEIAEETDYSWYSSLVFLWSSIEVDVGIMCACVPGLKPLVSKFLPHLLRDANDPVSKQNSISSVNEHEHMNDFHRVPSLPTLPPDVARRDFSIAHAPSSEDGDGEMGMMDFLTTPEMHDFPRAERTQTALTNTSRHTAPGSANFFDFVNMKQKKSIVHMTTRESIYPIAMVTVMFFIWGFEYGLIDVLNSQFQSVARMSSTQSTGIHSAYFAGYFFGPLLVGRLVLIHWGFKACYVVGLAIFSCGTLIYWPAAVLTSFPAFVVTNFLVAFGLSILEISANPYIALCGPPQYGEIRLNFSQGVQAIGSIVAPLIADKAFIHKASDGPSLVDTQWAYMGIALFTVLLALAYYYIPLPEASDTDLDDAAERLDGANTARLSGRYPIIWVTLAFAIFSQFCYVAGQEVNGTQFTAYLAAVSPAANPANRMAIAHTAFAFSRFLAAGMGFIPGVKPRHLLLAFYLLAILFSALSLHPSSPVAASTYLTLVFFAEGPIYSLIFAQALRGLGRHTKSASAGLTAAVSGGAFLSPFANIISSSQHRPIFALVVSTAAFAAGTVFPLELNLVPQSRRQCDPLSPQQLGQEDARAGTREGSQASSRASRTWSFLHLGGGKKEGKLGSGRGRAGVQEVEIERKEWGGGSSISGPEGSP